MKIALNFIVSINQMRNNHESTYFNLIGHFWKFLAFSKMLARQEKFRNHVSCFYAHGGNIGVWASKWHGFLSLFRFLPEICLCVGKPKLFPIFY